MIYQRLLYVGRSGKDVRYMKDALVKLGYLAASTHARFGYSTKAAVMLFQERGTDEEGLPLQIDGIIGKHTWYAIEAAAGLGDSAAALPQSGLEPSLSLPEQLGDRAKVSLGAALSGIAEKRRMLVQTALRFAYDPACPADYPQSLYIRGGNLFNADLRENIITRDRILSGAARQPQYYDGGRKEMMLRAVENNPSLTGADCSGGVVGLLRNGALVASGFDATADALCSDRYSYALSQEALLPGDFVGRSGHIGLYVGGGYAVEWMGGAYGCQLTALDARRGYDFVRRRMRSFSGWTKFRRPKWLA